MTEAALEVSGLTRRYGRITAVEQLAVRVEEGDVYGFLGPNGAGKTTAMRCMLGLIRMDAGRVRMFGVDDIVAARRQIGAIIETPVFHRWMSGRANLEQAAALAGIPYAKAYGEIERVLDRVGLKDRAGDAAGTYSLGMRQRLGIARALLGGPRMLFLDEPTNGLDPAGMREMRDLIRSLALHDQITIFISSHLLGEVQAICNRVGIIQKGRMRAEGTVKELISEEAGQAVVEVGSPDPEALKVALESIEGVSISGPGASGRIRVQHGELPIPTLNRKLMQAGVDVDALVPAQRNLEDVFLEVVEASE